AGRSGRSNSCLRLLRLLGPPVNTTVVAEFVILVWVGLGAEIPFYRLQQIRNRSGLVLEGLVHILVNFFRIYTAFLSYSSAAPAILRVSSKPPAPLLLSFNHNTLLSSQ